MQRRLQLQITCVSGIKGDVIVSECTTVSEITPQDRHIWPCQRLRLRQCLDRRHQSRRHRTRRQVFLALVLVFLEGLSQVPPWSLWSSESFASESTPSSAVLLRVRGFPCLFNGPPMLGLRRN